MKPAQFDLGIQIGATFEPKVLMALDDEFEPVDLDGFTPFATVKDEPGDSIVLDLDPQLILPDPLANPVTVAVGSQDLTSAAHDLIPGITLKFSSTGTLPLPLRSTERYIVMVKGFTSDKFRVISFHSALNGFSRAVRIRTTGVGVITATICVGQILLPEITDEVTEVMTEHDGNWDLMLEDSFSRRLAPFMRGKFPIKYGNTDPP